MMAHRNTPDQESGLSPAQVLYGCDLPDAIKFKATADRFSDKDIRPQWREAWHLKELANQSRFSRNLERRKEHGR